MIKQYVFGPVASRRLGISLGVDLVRPKTCSLNCIYCEAKETTDLTLERKEYVPIDAVIAELDEVLRTKPELDYITFSGSGEPTLNSGIGRVVSFLKEKHPEYRICLLTNGFALGDRQLRSEIEPVDLIVPSLDASNAEEFEVINRPHPDLKFDGFIRDLTDFCRTTKSLVHLELFIVPGVNDSDESIARFVELIRPMRVPLVQLNTLDRPGVVDWIRPSTAGNTDIPLSVTAQVGAAWEVQDGALVCPMDGYAIVSGGLMIGGGAAGHYCGVDVRKNNASVVDLYFGYSINYGAIATRPVLVQVQAGDLLRLRYRSDSTADISASPRTGLTVQYV